MSDFEDPPVRGHAQVQQLVGDDEVLKARLRVNETAGRRDGTSGTALADEHELHCLRVTCAPQSHPASPLRAVQPLH
jgi:hypothetical protein